MRVGLVTLVTPREMTGIGHYVTGLIEGLQALDHEPEDRYIVFGSPDLSSRLAMIHPAFDLETVRIPETPRLLMRPAYFAWQNSWFQVAARRHRLDAVHVPNLVPVFTGTSRVAMTIGDLTDHHVPGKYSLARQAYRVRLSVSMARRMAQVITFSEHSRRDIVVRTGVQPDKITVTPLAAALPFERALRVDNSSARHRLPVSAPFVLHLGKLLAHKNIERLLAAMALLVARGLPHHLVLAGPTVGRGSVYQALARRLGIADRLKILDYVSYDEAATLCQAADVVAVPSIYEGFGLTVLEAMRAGTPVVAACATSLPEVGGDAAVFVDPFSEASIANGLERVLRDPTLAARLRAQGRARAASFSWRECAVRTRQVYRCLASARAM